MSFFIIFFATFALGSGFFTKDDLQKIRSVSARIVVETSSKTGLLSPIKNQLSLEPTTSSYAICSAVMISQNIALTAAHCLNQFNQRTHAGFNLESNFDGHVIKRTIQKIKVAQDYISIHSWIQRLEVLKLFFYQKLSQSDIGVIFLNKIPVDQTETLQFDLSNIYSEDILLQYSYNGDTSSNSQGTFKVCSAAKQNNAVLSGHCLNSLVKGNSGGPLFVKKNGELKLVGITSMYLKSWFNDETEYLFTQPLSFYGPHLEDQNLELPYGTPSKLVNN